MLHPAKAAQSQGDPVCLRFCLQAQALPCRRVMDKLGGGGGADTKEPREKGSVARAAGAQRVRGYMSLPQPPVRKSLTLAHLTPEPGE